MKQGASRHALSERGHDLYETPDCATHSLVKCAFGGNMNGMTVWEPSAGRGAISRILRQYGAAIFSSDLVKYDGADEDVVGGLDFLTTADCPYKTIITNPPYKFADKFIEHALELGCEAYYLLRLMAIEGARRTPLMAHCKTIYAGIERLPMMHREGWEGNKIGMAGVPFGWFHFTPETHDHIVLKRITWRS